MKKILLFSLISFLGQFSQAQLQKVELSTYSFYVNKRFTIDDKTKDGKGIKVHVSGKNKSEPAGMPIYLTVKIQCGQGQFKDIDLGKYFIKSYGKKFLNFLSAKSTSHPYGQVHVCALENVNFDEEKIIISVLEPSSSGCKQDEKMDFIIPIKDFCQ